MEERVTPDQQKTEEFVGKMLEDVSASMTVMLAAIGDRLGLFKELAEGGPATSGELAARADINERYAREWLGAMSSAGYLHYTPDSGRFKLPAEHSPALAQERGPFFFGGTLQMLPALFGISEKVTAAFRNGGGVTQSAYHEDFWEGMSRFTDCWFDNLLVQEWVPAMPIVQSKLENGVSVADVGCGRGHALIRLVEAFPNSTFIGYDVFAPTIEKAARAAREAGVDDRVSFQQLDVGKGIPEQFDIITTFDVVHDAVDPPGLLRDIHQALSRDGVYVCLDINCSDKLEENAGPLGSLFHGFSIFYCMTTSLANGGVGLGTLGFHEHKVKELCTEAGFSSVRTVPLENPFNNLYEIRP